MDKINLTESQLHRIIKESVKTILVEIGYRTATLAAGANMKANNDIRNGIIYYGKRKRNNMDKVDKSAKLDYKAISQSVIDNVGAFTLLFLKTEKDRMFLS